MLTEIKRHFSVDKTTVITQIITGLGGVGKTQLALEYAHQSTCYDAILWFQAETDLSSQYSYIAQDTEKGLD